MWPYFLAGGVLLWFLSQPKKAYGMNQYYVATNGRRWAIAHPGDPVFDKGQGEEVAIARDYFRAFDPKTNLVEHIGQTYDEVIAKINAA
jgi:hypothetical protein